LWTKIILINPILNLAPIFEFRNGRAQHQIIKKMNGKSKEVSLDAKQLPRLAKRKAMSIIGGWVDHVHSVGGGDSTHDWHSSSTGLSGSESEDDDQSSTEEDELATSPLGSQRDSGTEQDVLSEVWGEFLRKGRTHAAREAKRSRLDSGDDSGREELSRDMESTSEDNDSSSEGSEGSAGSIEQFIVGPGFFSRR